MIVGLILISWSCIVILNILLIQHEPATDLIPALIALFIGASCLAFVLTYLTTSEDIQHYTKTEQYKLTDVTLVKKNTGEKTVVDTCRYNVLIASGEHQEITKLKESLASYKYLNDRNPRFQSEEIVPFFKSYQ